MRLAPTHVLSASCWIINIHVMGDMSLGVLSKCHFMCVAWHHACPHMPRAGPYLCMQWRAKKVCRLVSFTRPSCTSRHSCCLSFVYGFLSQEPVHKTQTAAVPACGLASLKGLGDCHHSSQEQGQDANHVSKLATHPNALQA